MQVESAHARHAVALSTRRMRSNKIEFLPVEDEFKRKKTAKRQRNKTLEHQESLQKATKRFCREQTRKKDKKNVDNQQPVLKMDSSEG